jgi:hypothetical protein
MAHWGKRMLSCCGKVRETKVNDIEESETLSSTYRALRAAAWASVALGVTALGLFVGYELRVRYKFNRRTPSDFYSHAGEELGAEFGMGI